MHLKQHAVSNYQHPIPHSPLNLETEICTAWKWINQCHIELEYLLFYDLEMYSIQYTFVTEIAYTVNTTSSFKENIIGIHVMFKVILWFQY